MMTKRATDKASMPASVMPGAGMRGSVRRRILIALLVLASGFMVYRLVFLQSTARPGSTLRPGEPDRTGRITAGSPRSTPTAKSIENAQIDPSLRLDLLNNSRAVNYTGSKRNIFLMGAAPTRDSGAPSSGETAAGNGAGSGATTTPVQPPPPPPPPPVVIPLKYYGVAERSGTANTRALLTNGDTILIAQVGQTVAQHFRILRIGLTRLELEDIRDRSTHDIPLEEGGSAAPPAAPPAGVR